MSLHLQSSDQGKMSITAIGRENDDTNLSDLSVIPSRTIIPNALPHDSYPLIIPPLNRPLRFEETLSVEIPQAALRPFFSEKMSANAWASGKFNMVVHCIDPWMKENWRQYYAKCKNRRLKGSSNEQRRHFVRCLYLQKKKIDIAWETVDLTWRTTVKKFPDRGAAERSIADRVAAAAVEFPDPTPSESNEMDGSLDDCLPTNTAIGGSVTRSMRHHPAAHLNISPCVLGQVGSMECGGRALACSAKYEDMTPTTIGETLKKAGLVVLPEETYVGLMEENRRLHEKIEVLRLENARLHH